MGSDLEEQINELVPNKPAEDELFLGIHFLADSVADMLYSAEYLNSL